NAPRNHEPRTATLGQFVEGQPLRSRFYHVAIRWNKLVIDPHLAEWGTVDPELPVPINQPPLVGDKHWPRAGFVKVEEVPVRGLRAHVRVLIGLHSVHVEHGLSTPEFAQTLNWNLVHMTPSTHVRFTHRFLGNQFKKLSPVLIRP